VSNDASKPRSNIRVPLIMLGSLIFIILASTLLFRASVLGTIDLPKLLGTKNNGTLVQPPQPIAELPLQTTDGQPFDYAKLPKQWTLLLPASRSCDERCQQMLYTTRQLHMPSACVASWSRLSIRSMPPSNACSQSTRNSRCWSRHSPHSTSTSKKPACTPCAIGSISSSIRKAGR
jgi:hypothetical protein